MNFPLFRRRGAGFARTMMQSFPETIVLPEAIVEWFHWIEANGLDRTATDGSTYAILDEAQDSDLSVCSITVEPVDPRFCVGWSETIGEATINRFAAFVRTGGDGSMAGIWLDDDGRIQFVHHGSGSGSTLACVLADNAIDFLRFLAIGYEEACWPEDFDKTPEEIFRQQQARYPDEPPPMRPERFRSWLQQTFDVEIPSRACEIVKSIALMEDDASDDPFWKFTRRLSDGD